MIAIAVGEMGLSLESFLSLTPFEFQQAYLCFLNRQSNDREWEYLKSMRVARWQVWRTLCPPQQKKISIYDLVELTGDEEQIKFIEEEAKRKNIKSTQERFEELNNKWSDE